MICLEGAAEAEEDEGRGGLEPVKQPVDLF